jgi:Fe-S-cluster-containing hydrogenase component 2
MKIPHMHPEKNKILICDLCEGDPQCVKACIEANYDALGLSREMKPVSHKLFSKTPEELTELVAENLYAEKAKELI